MPVPFLAEENTVPRLLYVCISGLSLVLATYSTDCLGVESQPAPVGTPAPATNPVAAADAADMATKGVRALQDRLESIDESVKAQAKSMRDQAMSAANEQAKRALENDAPSSLTLGVGLMFPFLIGEEPKQSSPTSVLMPYIAWYPGRENQVTPVGAECAQLQQGKSGTEAKAAAKAAAATILRDYARFKRMKREASMDDEEILEAENQNKVFGSVYYQPTADYTPRCWASNVAVVLGRPGEYEAEFRKVADNVAAKKQTATGIVSIGIAFSPSSKFSIMAGLAATSIQSSNDSADYGLSWFVGLGANAELLSVLTGK